MTENNNCGHTFTNGITYLLIGGGIGAGLALLFAPKSGTALRGDIVDVTRKGYDATREKATALKDQSVAAVSAVKEKAEAVYDFASAKIAAGTEALNNATESAAEIAKDGIDKVQNEVENASKQIGNGRKSTSIV